MRKYWIANDCESKCIHQLAEAAEAINNKHYWVAPTVYTLLNIHADNITLEYDENSDMGRFYDIGIAALEKMGVITIGGVGETDGVLDDYKMIWIEK